MFALYFDDRAWWTGDDMSDRHRSYVDTMLRYMGKALASQNIPLVVSNCPVEDLLFAITQRAIQPRLHSYQETGNAISYTRDRRVGKALASRQIPWKEYHDICVFRGLKNRDDWQALHRKRMSKALAPALGRQGPSSCRKVIETLDSLFREEQFKSFHIQANYRSKVEHVTRIEAGCQNEEDSADRVMESFFARRSKRYLFDISKPSRASASCSRLSVYLAWGTVSFHALFQRTLTEIRRTQDKGHQSQMRAFLSRLFWHCHFIQRLESEPAIEFNNINTEYDGMRESAFCQDHFHKWKNGETGVPLVDASMRCLNSTGWLPFRMRAMLISFASYHYNLHWRRPALHLARQFLDYEPGIHFSQVQMQAGVTGINVPRMYNPVRQHYKNDPGHNFILEWVPELSSFKSVERYEPWKSVNSLRYPLFGAAPDIRLRQARQQYSKWRKNKCSKENAHKVYQLHGSRRRQSKTRDRQHVRRKLPTPPTQVQMEFSLFES